MKQIKVKTFEELTQSIKDGSDTNIQFADAVLDAVKKGLKNNYRRVSICDVEIEEEEEVIRLTSPFEDWPKALDGCMKTYINLEQYEKCSEIQKLQQYYEIKKLIK